MKKLLNVLCMVLAFSWMMLCALGYREYNTADSDFDKFMVSGLWFCLFVQSATDVIRNFK